MAVELDEIAVLARVSKQLERLSPAQRSWAMAFLERKFGDEATPEQLVVEKTRCREIEIDEDDTAFDAQLGGL